MRSRHRGFTIIEVISALSVAAVVMVVVGNILISSTHSVDYLVSDSASDAQIKKAILGLLAELESSAPTVITVSTADPDRDSVTFQTPGPYAGVVQWGAQDAKGTWHAGWSVSYQVVNGNLVRRVLDALGKTSGIDATLARSVDTKNLGTKGFIVGRVGSVVSATLRVKRDHPDKTTTRKEFSSAIYIKNT